MQCIAGDSAYAIYADALKYLSLLDISDMQALFTVKKVYALSTIRTSLPNTFIGMEERGNAPTYEGVRTRLG